MPVAGQPCQAVGQLVGQPGVDGIGIARLQPALAGDGICRHPIGDLQHRGTALAHIRPSVAQSGDLPFHPHMFHDHGNTLLILIVKSH